MTTAKNKVVTVGTIIREWLEANGYDGLCSGVCGCGLNGLMPCSNTLALHCRPAKHVTWDTCPVRGLEAYDGCIYDLDEDECKANGGCWALPGGTVVSLAGDD